MCSGRVSQVKRVRIKGHRGKVALYVKLRGIIKCSYKGKTALEPLGAGRFFSAEFLELANYTLFDESLNRLLDDFGYEEILRLGAGVEYYGIDEGVVFMVKGDWEQMNDWHAVTTADTVSSTEYSFKGYEILRRMLSKEVFDQIFLKKQRTTREEPRRVELSE